MLLLTSSLWLILALGPLLLLEHWIHRHLQGIFLLISGHPDIALALYSLAFLPGIIVHEGSHWLMARALFVRTAGFSVIPRHTPEGALRLGFVETERVDFLREALIGAAPLIAGSAVILLAGYSRLGAGAVGLALASGDVGAALNALRASWNAPDFWIWLYLMFTVSNAMMPSPSDRRAWPLALLASAVVAALLFWLGVGQFVANAVAEWLAAATRVIASAFTLTVVVDVFAVALLWPLEGFLETVTRRKVDYSG